MKKRINTRSPFFVQYYSTEDNVTCDIKVWSGDIVVNKPTEITYTLQKEPVNGAVTYEISELIRDFLAQTSSLTSGYAWVEVVLNDGVNAEDAEVFFATEGYTLSSEPVQQPDTLSSNYTKAIPTSKVSVAEGKVLSIPVYLDGENGADYRYQITDNNGLAQGWNEFSVSNESSSQVQYVTVNSTDTLLELDYNDVVTQTIVIQAMRCAKYEPMLLTYVNKFGAKAQEWFTLVHKETLRSKSDSYERSLMNYSSLTAGNQLHGVRRRVNDVKQMFDLNGDYISEADVEAYEEILLSEYVWLSINGGTNIPVNIKTSTLEKKKHAQSGLIRYKFQLETANNYINNIR